MSLSALLLLTVSAGLAPAAAPVAPRRDPAPARAAGFSPDPRSVQRYGPAYRYPQAGWIVLHVEGTPYARGVQHGRLLAPEIAAHVHCYAALQSPRAPTEGWELTRTLANALFLRRYQKEYLEEMKGIADGASAAGAAFDGRPLDLIDIVALNAWPELDTLDSALEATPTGLEGLRCPTARPRTPVKPKPARCSAFAATGPATRDGKVVFGHITMFSLYPCSFYNVWLDVKPARGHRVLMQTYPGGVQSGLDYYLNDAGLLICETTLEQTHFDPKGAPLASRIRQALQYADSIDKAVAIIKADNNGLYTNEWLLADTKTNEIALFALGTRQSKLYRSSKGEWFGGTRGFYWGCNNTKDLELRLETIPGTADRPARTTFVPSERDRKWLQLYDRYEGKIDADFARLAFTTPPLAAFHSCDAKYTTTDLAKDLQTWALFGPPLGRTWKPTFGERKRYPEVTPLVSNPWVILHARAPEAVKLAGPAPADLHDPLGVRKKATTRSASDPVTVPAWHGTLLPKSDADVWLASAFAGHERLVALEKALREDSGGTLKCADRDRLALGLFAHRANYELGVRAQPEAPLAKTKSDVRHNAWHRVAAGKGVLLLEALRAQLGSEAYEEMMEGFGKTHGGKRVTTGEFRAHVEKWPGARSGFFEPWLTRTGLPVLRLGKVTETPGEESTTVRVEVRQEGAWPRLIVPVTVETARGEETRELTLDGASGEVTIETSATPLRVVVDKYNRVPRRNGGPFSVLSFYPEVEQALIVYGTRDEVATNREAAVALEQALRRRGANVTVRVKPDTAVSEADLKGHHLLLIGRPDSNALVERFRAGLPVTFGPRSLVVRGKVYAHPGTAVLAAAENPANRRYSVVVIAGLGPASTRAAAPRFAQGKLPAGEVVVLPHGGSPQALVVPAKELVRELSEVRAVKRER
jgi:hypothetical protein